MARLWAMTATYESVQAGDELPIVVKWETAESIARFLAQTEPAAAAAAAAEAGDAAQVPAAMLDGYARELLEKGLPVPPEPADALRLDWQTLSPIAAGDTLSLSGRVTGKGERDSRRWIDCQITVSGADGQTLGTATAAVAL